MVLPGTYAADREQGAGEPIRKKKKPGPDFLTGSFTGNASVNRPTKALPAQLAPEDRLGGTGETTVGWLTRRYGMVMDSGWDPQQVPLTVIHDLATSGVDDQQLARVLRATSPLQERLTSRLLGPGGVQGQAGVGVEAAGPASSASPLPRPQQAGLGIPSLGDVWKSGKNVVGGIFTSEPMTSAGNILNWPVEHLIGRPLNIAAQYAAPVTDAANQHGIWVGQGDNPLERLQGTRFTNPKRRAARTAPPSWETAWQRARQTGLGGAVTSLQGIRPEDPQYAQAVAVNGLFASFAMDPLLVAGKVGQGAKLARGVPVTGEMAATLEGASGLQKATKTLIPAGGDLPRSRVAVATYQLMAKTPEKLAETSRARSAFEDIAKATSPTYLADRYRIGGKLPEILANESDPTRVRDWFVAATKGSLPEFRYDEITTKIAEHTQRYEGLKADVLAGRLPQETVQAQMDGLAVDTLNLQRMRDSSQVGMFVEEMPRETLAGWARQVIKRGVGDAPTQPLLQTPPTQLPGAAVRKIGHPVFELLGKFYQGHNRASDLTRSLFETMPRKGEQIAIDNLDDGRVYLERIGQLLRVPRADLDRLVDRYLTHSGSQEAYTVIDDLFKAGKTLHPEITNDMLRINKRANQSLYHVGDTPAGEEMHSATKLVDGKETAFPQPQLDSELITHFPVPDVDAIRDILSLTGSARRVLREAKIAPTSKGDEWLLDQARQHGVNPDLLVKAYQGGDTLVGAPVRVVGRRWSDSARLSRAFVSGAWVPSVLIRVGFLLRQTGEEAFALGASGLTSVLHPAEMFKAVRSKGEFALWAERPEEFLNRAARDVAKKQPTSAKVRFGDDSFLTDWRGELNQIKASEVAREYLHQAKIHGGGPEAADEVVKWLNNHPTGRSHWSQHRDTEISVYAPEGVVEPPAGPMFDEATAEELLHGTYRDFDTFDAAAKNRYGRGTSGGVYFTDKLEIAEKFSRQKASQFDPDDFRARWDAEEPPPGVDPDAPDAAAAFRGYAEKRMAKGDTFALRDPETGAETILGSADGLPPLDSDDAWNVVRYPKGVKPKVIKAKVYGKTLDLRVPDKMGRPDPDALQRMVPEGLRDKLKGRLEGVTSKGRFEHEHTPELVEWAKAEGYGKIKVWDSYESGGDSIIAIPDQIGYGREAAAVAPTGLTEADVQRRWLEGIGQRIEDKTKGNHALLTLLRDGEAKVSVDDYARMKYGGQIPPKVKDLLEEYTRWGQGGGPLPRSDLLTDLHMELGVPVTRTADGKPMIRLSINDDDDILPFLEGLPPEARPTWVKGTGFESGGASPRHQRFTALAMEWLNDKPLNGLLRMPSFRKFATGKYNWLRASGHSDEAAKELAKKYALNRMKNVMYDYGEKSRFNDQMLVLSPFMNAQQQIMRRWLLDIPGRNGFLVGQANMARRAQLYWEGLKQLGVIHKNDRDEWVTHIPGLDQAIYHMTDMLPGVTGVKVETDVPLERFTMLLNPSPGLGPVTQKALAELPWIRDQWDKDGFVGKSLNWLAPYGPESSLGPAWVNRLYTGVTKQPPPWEFGRSRKYSEYQWAGSKMDAIRLLDAKGFKDGLTRLEQINAMPNSTAKTAALDQFYRDAEQLAADVYITRGLTGGVLPAQPNIYWPGQKESEAFKRKISDVVGAPAGPDGTYTSEQSTARQNLTNEFLQKHPELKLFLFSKAPQVPFSDGTVATGTVFDYKSYMKELHQGIREQWDPHRYMVVGAGANSYWHIQEEYQRAINAAGSTAAERLQNWHMVKEANQQRADDIDTLEDLNPDWDAWHRKTVESMRAKGGQPPPGWREDVAKDLFQVESEIKNHLAELDPDGDLDLSGFDAARAKLRDGLAQNPWMTQQKGPDGEVARYWRDVADPYYTDLEKLYEQAQTLPKGERAPIYEQIRAYKNNYKAPNGLPSPEAVAFQGLDRPGQAKQVAKWSTQPPGWLTNFQREQLGLPADERISEFWTVMNEAEAKYRNWRIENNISPSSTEWRNARQTLDNWKRSVAERNGLTAEVERENFTPFDRAWSAQQLTGPEWQPVRDLVTVSQKALAAAGTDGRPAGIDSEYGMQLMDWFSQQMVGQLQANPSLIPSMEQWGKIMSPDDPLIGIDLWRKFFFGAFR